MENFTVDIKVAPELRRIDDLGRVVIPKRIREMLKIDEGDMLEECVVNVEGKSSYGVLITPMREKNPEERLLKKAAALHAHPDEVRSRGMPRRICDGGWHAQNQLF